MSGEGWRTLHAVGKSSIYLESTAGDSAAGVKAKGLSPRLAANPLLGQQRALVKPGRCHMPSLCPEGAQSAPQPGCARDKRGRGRGAAWGCLQLCGWDHVPRQRVLMALLDKEPCGF